MMLTCPRWAMVATVLLEVNRVVLHSVVRTVFVDAVLQASLHG